MPSPEICIIAAMSENRVIGNKGKIPWRIPEDMKHFRELTVPHPVIMGRKTFESIGKPLAGRPNIIITRGERKLYPDGRIMASSLEHGILAGQYLDKERIFIAGGGQIYEQSIHLANRLFLTLVEGQFVGDTYFPDYSEFSKVVSLEEGQSGEYRYKFLELVRGR